MSGRVVHLDFDRLSQGHTEHRLDEQTAATADDFLTISPRIRVMPIIHGSGDFAIQVREELLAPAV